MFMLLFKNSLSRMCPAMCGICKYYDERNSCILIKLLTKQHHETYYRLRNFESSCELAGMKVSSSDSKSDLKVGI